MKSKITLAVIATIITVSNVGVAHAQNPAAGLNVNANAAVDTQANINRGLNAQASSSASVTVRGNATSSAMKNENASASSTRGNATSTAAQNVHASSTPGTQGKLISETRQSVVATFVQTLLAVADREGGIGTQVRAVAQSQNDSASTTAIAMAKVDGRGAFHTFLTGSDYKNLGVIRSEIATTSANIARLKAVLDQTTSDTNRAELSAQIQVLEDEQAKINTYVTANENKFSLFGWFNRLFVK